MSENSTESQKTSCVGNKSGGRRLRLFLQHTAITAAFIISLFIMFGSSVDVDDVSGSTRRYYMTTSMENDRHKDRSFEDSGLFRDIFAKEAKDVMRLGTIRMQMETDGKFDSDKVIDVTAYDMRNENLPEQYVTADYKLGDLLKWNKHGFEYEERILSQDQQRSFLSEETRYRVIDSDDSDTALNYYTFDQNESSHDISEKDESAHGFAAGNGNDTSGSRLIIDSDADKSVNETANDQFEILDCRYNTVDGRKVEDIVSDWGRYDTLCSNIEEAADNLSINHEDYDLYTSFYEKSNLKYLIQTDVNGTKQYYTNTSLGGKDEKAVTQLFKSYGRYLYYSPADLVYDTNISVTEDDFNNIIGKYTEAYSENAKIWLAVDTSYQVKTDSFCHAKEGYRNYIPYYRQMTAAMVILIVASFVIFIVNTVCEGRDGTLYRTDKIPVEIDIALIICLFYCLMYYAFGFIPSHSEHMYIFWVKIMCGLVIFAGNILFMFLYLSLVRRARNHCFWKTTILYQLTRWLNSGPWIVYDNGGLIARTWLPFIIISAFNACCFMSRSPLIILVVVIDLLGGILVYRQAKERMQIIECMKKIEGGDFSYKIPTGTMHGDNLVMANAVNSIGDSIKKAVETSTKDERLKADLITNVSHDIKTPLTSIINYVDLLKREDSGNNKVSDYVRILDEKSQRLKQLTEDLVEASKISSGNIVLNMTKINMAELIQQTIGEFSDKFDASGLTVIVENSASDSYISADSRRIWRVVENLFNNACKYAMTGTRVYISMENIISAGGHTQLKTEVKNISATALNCNPDELTERFIRGDTSRTTEGSGLGLSIAKSLTQLQNGEFKIMLDGDLFKAVILFDSYHEEK